MKILSRKLSRTSKKQHEDYFEVTITEDFVKVEHPDWSAPQMIRWDDIDAVRMINTNQGPWVPDVWLILDDKNQRCTIPLGAKGFEEVYQIVSKYEGFDFDNFGSSICCTYNAEFLLWTSGRKIKSMKNNRYLFIFFFVILLLSGCFQLFDPGPATKIKSVLSPSKKWQAILFVKGGNATEADSYQVSIKRADNELDATEVGNTFTVDGDHGKAYLDSNSIRFSWTRDDLLVINYDKKLRFFIKQNSVGPVNVLYEPR